MKKIVTSLCFLLAGVIVSAQDQDQSFHFGIKAAPTLAWLKSDTEGYDSDGSKFGFSYGAVTDFNFASRYAFSTGLDITYRGGKFKSLQQLSTIADEDSLVSESSSYTMQYLEIPITLKLKTNEIGNFTYFIQLGVEPGWLIRAKKSFESTTQTTIGGVQHTTNDSGDNVDVKEDINNFNLSMILGAGLEYTLSGETVLLAGLQFNNGFLDAFDGDPDVNTNYLALTLGVLF